MNWIFPPKKKLIYFYPLLTAYLNVVKQRDLCGFYRHFYMQTFYIDQLKDEEPEESVTGNRNVKKQAVDAAESEV